jgi:hypothetical protein
MDTMKNIILIAFLLISKSVYGQQDSLKFWTKDQPLQWADFIAPVNESSRFYAETYSGTHYSYTSHTNDTGRVFTFKVYSYLSKGRSWSNIDKQTPELLKHEQLHFDISEYFARQLLIALNKYNYTADYQNEIRSVFQAIEEERSTMETVYDLRTSHSLNKKAQTKWSEFITDILTHDYSLSDVLARELTVK